MGRAGLLVLLVTCSAWPQPVGGGLKAGVPFQKPFSLMGAGFQADRVPYIIGPFIELRFPKGLALEVDSLYERLRFQYEFSRPGLALEKAETTASSWQFPVLVKYRFRAGVAAPFVSGGVTANYIGNIRQIGETIPQLPGDVRRALERAGESFWNGGGVVGGGVEFRAAFIRIAPELRYTRWAIGKTVGTDIVSLKINEGQVQFLLGVSF